MRMADEQDLGNQLPARQKRDIESARPALARCQLVEACLRLHIRLSFVVNAGLRHHDLLPVARLIDVEFLLCVMTAFTAPRTGAAAAVSSVSNPHVPSDGS